MHAWPSIALRMFSRKTKASYIIVVGYDKKNCVKTLNAWAVCILDNT